MVISESRIKSDATLRDNIDIPGYDFVNTPSETSAGGVGMFIKRGTTYEVKNDLRLNTNGCEDIWIEVTLQGRPRVIGGIRHHRNQYTQFQKILTSTIAALNIKNKPFYVVGGL